VIITLHDRDPLDLAMTYKQLVKAIGPRTDVEIIFGYDFEPGDFPHVEDMTENLAEAMGDKAQTFYWNTIKERPQTWNLYGHCNPVGISNQCMDRVRGLNTVWLQSDTMVNPFFFLRMDNLCDDDGALETVWCSRVIDRDSCAEFCGITRPAPFMWCCAHKTTSERMDLNLLNGLGYDDNDWMARMAILYGSITIDLGHLAIHQTHGEVTVIGQIASGKAYEPGTEIAWKNSTEYMQKKWGGIPFDQKTLKFKIMDISDYIVMEYVSRLDGK